MPDELPRWQDLLDDEDEARRLEKLMYPHMVAGFKQGVENTAETKKPDDLFTGYRRDKYKSKSVQYAAAVVGTMAAKLQDAIDETYRKGDGVPGLAGRVNALYGSSMGWRSLRIARTQLTESINDGVTATLTAEGNQTKTWSTVIDGAERESHAVADGQTVGIHEPFQLAGGSGMFPGDGMLPIGETANCRCTVVGGDDSDRMRRYRGKLFLRTHGALERRYVVSLRRAFRAQRDRVITAGRWKAY